MRLTRALARLEGDDIGVIRTPFAQTGNGEGETPAGDDRQLVDLQTS
jgi:hypothetical protein